MSQSLLQYDRSVVRPLLETPARSDIRSMGNAPAKRRQPLESSSFDIGLSKGHSVSFLRVTLRS